MDSCRLSDDEFIESLVGETSLRLLDFRDDFLCLGKLNLKLLDSIDNASFILFQVQGDLEIGGTGDRIGLIEQRINIRNDLPLVDQSLEFLEVCHPVHREQHRVFRNQLPIPSGLHS